MRKKPTNREKFTLDYVCSKYNIDSGHSVIHVGAHYLEEYSSYVDKNFTQIYYIEGDPQKYLEISNKSSERVKIINAIVSNEPKKVDFYVASNNGASSSILKPKLHLSIHPEITFSKKETNLKSTKIDEIFKSSERNDLMVLDIQGAELLALEGGKSTIANTRFIYTEYSLVELYENCTVLRELVEFLEENNFSIIELSFEAKTGAGDALFVNKRFTKEKFSRLIIPRKYPDLFYRLNLFLYYIRKLRNYFLKKL
jgi:FkbM family methyltransferase